MSQRTAMPRLALEGFEDVECLLLRPMSPMTPQLSDGRNAQSIVQSALCRIDQGRATEKLASRRG